MRRAIAAAALLFLTALLGDSQSAHAQKKPAIDKDKDADKTSEKMIAAGKLVGVVKNIYEERRKFRMQVTVSRLKLDQGQLGAMQNAQNAFRQAQINRDINAMRNAQRDYAVAQARLYTVEHVKQDVELEARDDVVVRMAWPKEDFDDKGRLKKYTKEELKELKGNDPKLPGYRAEFGDMTTEQVVEVRLIRKKGPIRPPVRPKKKGKDADATDVDVLADNTPQVSMIVILRNPPPSK